MKAACKDCSGECAHASGSERDKQIYSSRGRKGAGDIQDVERCGRSLCGQCGVCSMLQLNALNNLLQYKRFANCLRN